MIAWHQLNHCLVYVQNTMEMQYEIVGSSDKVPKNECELMIVRHWVSSGAYVDFFD